MYNCNFATEQQKVRIFLEVFCFNKIEEHRLIINFTCFWNEQKISQSVIYHFGIAFSRRASKNRFQVLRGCVNLFLTKVWPCPKIRTASIAISRIAVRKNY